MRMNTSKESPLCMENFRQTQNADLGSECPMSQSQGWAQGVQYTRRTDCQSDQTVARRSCSHPRRVTC